jgi:ABC-type dipeptide/oligopeptide/nickel transport system permease subunit
MRLDRRKLTAALLALSALLLLAALVYGAASNEAAMETDFSRKNLAPSAAYPFGTDWMGRDMFARTFAGLSLSIRLGILTATVSAAFAFALGACAAAMGKAADSVISFLIDLVMGVPHMLLLILISFACGKGFWGVAIGVIFSHWTSLARVIRGEILQLKQSGYVRVAAKLGQSRVQIIKRHMIPHLAPQFTVGLVLLFPHAILHEASITFLGFGLPPDQPAIGIILSESMRYLVTGQWWLAVFPGLALAATVMLFDYAGGAVRRLLDTAAL